MKMKVTLLSAISISFFAAAMVSCVDTDKDLFDSEKTKELYEETFPVKNIDPSMDWKTTNKVSAIVSVNEDYGVDYRVRIYTANPLISNSGAKLLAEGTANQDLKFKTDFDCPTSQTALYVLRTDEKKRNVLRIVDVENNQISTIFGESAATRTNDELVIESYSPQYSETQLKELSSQAIEMTPGMILSPEVFYKVSAGNTFNGSVETYQGGTKNIIIEGTWNMPNDFKLQTGSVLYILSGGRVNLPKTLVQFVGSTHFAIYKGGAIIGDVDSNLQISNASGGYHNYNAGKIVVGNFDFNSWATSKIFNYGEVDFGLYNATNSGIFVNHNIANFNDTHQNAVIHNACKFTAKQLSGSLFIGSKGSAIIDKYLGAWGGRITIGKDAMMTIKNDASFGGVAVTGPTAGNALIKIGKLAYANDFKSRGNVYYEIGDYGFDINNQYDSSTNAIKGLNISKPSEAPIYIPTDQLCTGDGNIPGEGGEIEDNPMKMTYAFEDNYPQVGDYDFNDVVLNVSTQYDREKNTNNIKRIQYNVTLTAIGAVKKLGAGLRLVGINKSEIESVAFGGATAMRNTLANSVFENDIMESGDEVVIPLFGDAHGVYGYDSTRPILNTGIEQLSKLYTLEVIITLTDKSKTVPIITKENLDFFIAYGSSKRTEVHLYEFMNNGATIHGTVHPQNQAVAGKCTWAVCVPEFAYPKEYVRITNAYPNFESWAQDKNTNMDWYKYPVNDKVFDKAN